jgi:hypothetical protein
MSKATKRAKVERFMFSKFYLNASYEILNQVQDDRNSVIVNLIRNLLSHLIEAPVYFEGLYLI